MYTILSNWPLWFICVAMIFAAFIDGWKLKVPNWLTFPLVLSGWLLGILHSCGLLEGTGIGGFGHSLAGTALGFALLFPVYAIGGMGAGDVKMQMGFGAWIGAYYGFGRLPNPDVAGSIAIPNGLGIIFWAFCLAVILGGIIALAMILMRGQFRRNWANTREILGDLVKSASVEEVAGKADKRKPRMHLLPYGIPLCLGFVSYLLYLG
jgi:prepilin peptidase CpaA